jgi:hypothetical protein
LSEDADLDSESDDSSADQSRDFGEIDFASGRVVDQFDMSKSRQSDRNQVPILPKVTNICNFKYL